MVVPGRWSLPAIYNNYEMTCIMNPANLLHTKRKPTDPLIHFLDGPKVSLSPLHRLKHGLETEPELETTELDTLELFKMLSGNNVQKPDGTGYPVQVCKTERAPVYHNNPPIQPPACLFLQSWSWWQHQDTTWIKRQAFLPLSVYK